MKRLFAGIFLLLAVVLPAAAQTCSPNPFVLTNGQTADATQVMANFNNLLTCANTNLAPLVTPTFTGPVSITGTPLSVPNGGTGLAAITSNSLMVGNGASAPNLIAPGAANNLLQSSGAAWQSASLSQALGPILRGYLSGLTLSTAGGSGTMSISAGVGESDDVTTLMSLAAISKTTASWAVGSGNGGLDTGVIANSTWYHFFEIERLDTGVTDIEFSLSATTPTLPANYTKQRRFASGLTDGAGHWIAFLQRGPNFFLKVPVRDQNATVLTANTPASLTLASVPSGVLVRPILNVSAQATAGAAARVRLYSPDLPDNNSGDDANAAIQAGGATSVAGYSEIAANYVNTAQQIRVNTADTGVTLTIFTMGWIDDQGRF